MTLDDNIRREEGSSKNTYIQNPELNIKSKYSFLDVRINGVWTSSSTKFNRQNGHLDTVYLDNPNIHNWNIYLDRPNG